LKPTTLRHRVENIAEVWHFTLALIAIACGWYLSNWIIFGVLYAFALLCNGFVALIWLRLTLGKEDYQQLVVSLALENNPIVSQEEIEEIAKRAAKKP
jgi:hypothetical protein